MSSFPLILEIPLPKIDTDGLNCNVVLPSNIHDWSRQVLMLPKAERTGDRFRITQEACAYQFWLGISQDCGVIPIIESGGWFYDEKYSVDGDPDIHIFIESYGIMFLRQRGFADRDICHFLWRSAPQLRGIAMLAALPYWLQEQLCWQYSSCEIELKIVPQFMAKLEKLVNRYSDECGLRLER
jgi:hypothetical protein